MTPCGVQGINPGRFVNKHPAFIGCKPSTSFCGSISSNTAVSSKCSGSGICTKIPSTSGSRFKFTITSLNSFCDTFSSKRIVC